MYGRDDDYMPDFRYRITTTINHFARSFKQLGRLDDVEILVTDWGSLIPMGQTLKLSPEAARITRFIYISSEFIRSIQNGRDDFNASLAPNVAMRRANGKFILFSNADTLIPRYSMDTLFRLINDEIQISVDVERTFFLLPRLQVPWQFIERQPSLEEWDRYFLLCSKNTVLEPTPGYSFFGWAGAFIMHRSMWHNLRGMDERYAGYGNNDTDLGFRVSQHYPCLSLSSIGIILYHMGHSSKGQRQNMIKIPNPFILNTNLSANDENWGLGDVELDIQCPFIKSENYHEIHLNARKNVSIITDSGQNQTGLQSELQNIILVKCVKKSVISFIQKGWKIKEKDLNAFFLLAWYSNYCYPRKYLEFATGRTPASGVVALGCPSAEIYKVNKWDGNSPPPDPFDLCFIYEVSSYCGYLRFINGEINTAIEHLHESFIGSFTYDLCFVNEETLENDMFEYFNKLLPDMAPGGALVFISCSTDSFRSIRNKIQENFPDFTFISCADHRTGMIYAGQIMNQREKNTLIEDVLFDTSWFAFKKFKNRILHIPKKIVGPWFRQVLTNLNE
jgi:hypothetical protein